MKPEAAAMNFGIADIEAEVLPERKKTVVQRLRTEGVLSIKVVDAVAVEISQVSGRGGAKLLDGDRN
jgi:cation transport ATPase